MYTTQWPVWYLGGGEASNVILKHWYVVWSSDSHCCSSEVGPGIHTRLHEMTLLCALISLISLMPSASWNLALVFSLCCTLSTTESVSMAKIQEDSEIIKQIGICAMLLRSQLLHSSRKILLPKFWATAQPPLWPLSLILCHRIDWHLEQEMKEKKKEKEETHPLNLAHLSYQQERGSFGALSICTQCTLPGLECIEFRPSDTEGKRSETLNLISFPNMPVIIYFWKSLDSFSMHSV